MYDEILLGESNAPCRAGLLAELVVEKGGQSRGVELRKKECFKNQEAEVEKERDKQEEEEVIRVMDILGKEERKKVEGACLAGLMEGWET